MKTASRSLKDLATTADGLGQFFNKTLHNYYTIFSKFTYMYNK